MERTQLSRRTQVQGRLPLVLCCISAGLGILPPSPQPGPVHGTQRARQGSRMAGAAVPSAGLDHRGSVTPCRLCSHLMWACRTQLPQQVGLRTPRQPLLAFSKFRSRVPHTWPHLCTSQLCERGRGQRNKIAFLSERCSLVIYPHVSKPHTEHHLPHLPQSQGVTESMGHQQSNRQRRCSQNNQDPNVPRSRPSETRTERSPGLL